MYRIQENLDHLGQLIRNANRSRALDRNRKNDLCEGLKKCIERTQRSIHHFERQITRHRQKLQELCAQEDPTSFNCIRIEERINALRSECISLDFHHDDLDDLNAKYCQDETAVLPKKIKTPKMGIPRNPALGGVSLSRKLSSMFYRGVFAFYLHRFWTWLHSLFS